MDFPTSRKVSNRVGFTVLPTMLLILSSADRTSLHLLSFLSVYVRNSMFESV